jgi:hypothetical protein
MAFKPFGDLKVTTTTQIATFMNGSFDLGLIFDSIEPCRMVAPPVKSRFDSTHYSGVVPYGTILHVKYKQQEKGLTFKRKKKQTANQIPSKRSFFLNAVCFVIHLEKMVNFKLTNRKFQITGCKTSEQAHELVKHMYALFERLHPGCIRHDGAPPTFVFNTVMTNIDFNLDFFVDRTNLDKLFSDEENFISLLENSFGHAGVNIKHASQTKDKELTCITYDACNWNVCKVSWSDYLSKCTPKERENEQKKVKLHTFLVFHSGRGIHSGPSYLEMESVYNLFMQTLYSKKDSYKVEETLIKGDARAPKKARTDAPAPDERSSEHRVANPECIRA